MAGSVKAAFEARLKRKALARPDLYPQLSNTGNFSGPRGFRAFRGAKLKVLTVYGELGFDLFHIAAISP